MSKQFKVLLVLFSLLPNVALSAVYEFNFTGRLTIVGAGNVVADRDSAGVFDPYGAQIPISSTLTFDDLDQSGSFGLTVAPFSFFGSGDTVIHDVTFQRLAGNLLLGEMLIDWAGSTNIVSTTVWDGSGLFNAINNAPGGLQAGDVISGTRLIRDGDIIINDIGSATPATDGVNRLWVGGSGPNRYVYYDIKQGPAPLATTTWNYSDGVLFDDGEAGSPLLGGPFPGYNVTLDIGSGNSLTLISVNSVVVPVPAAVWLFISGALALFGFNRVVNKSG